MNDPGSGITADELSHYRAHVGRSEIRRQWLDVESLRRFAAASGADLEVERRPPPLAHWAYFLESVEARAIGLDGHPQRGNGILPPVRLPQRMFAASSIRVFAPLRLACEAELTLTVADVKHKIGNTGDLLLIDVQRCVTQEGQARITECQTLVYRGKQPRVAAIRCLEQPDPPECVLWTPRPVELFRFSAATFNSHRIHYDLPYAQMEEGYPGLVVHGPLTAAKLCAFAETRIGGGQRPHTFRFRALAPLFADQPVRLAATAESGRVEAIRCDGTVAMSAQWMPA